MAVNKDDFRSALRRFASGVTVISAASPEGEPRGMTASAFCSASLDPPLVLVCMDNRARTLPLVRERGRLGINVLARDQRRLSAHFARTHKDPSAALQAGARFFSTPRGTPLLEGCLACLDCHTHSEHPAGDHTIVVAHVDEVFLGAGMPLLYFDGDYARLERELPREPAPHEPGSGT